MNPWLKIPGKEYDAHMGSPEVDQLRFLSDIFETSLLKHQPQRIAVLGCATGNGFERIDWGNIEKVTGFDINPGYIKSIDKKFAQHSNKLQLVCADLQNHDLAQYQFDLVFAGLIFEYLDAKKLLKNIRQSLGKNSRLVVVLQMANSKYAKVSKTPYKSLESLSDYINLQDPESFRAKAEELAYVFLSGNVSVLKSGKKFWTGHFGLV